MEYGVAVNNKYELFLEECDDPLEILQRNQEEAAKSKVEKTNAKNAPTKKSGAKTTAATTKPAGKTTSKPAQQPTSVLTESKSNKINPDSSAPRKDTERPPRFGSRQNENLNRPPRQQQSFGFVSSGEFEKRENGPRSEFSREAGDRENGRGRGGFRRGRGGPGRGRGGEAGFDRFGKREFDRHSGTGQGGVKATDKREGGGAHNWGNIKDDIEDQLKPMDVTQEQTTEGEQTNVEGGPVENKEVAGEEGESNTAELEEETKQMTLDEWKKLEEQRKVKTEFNIRQAGEGYKVDPKWKKMYQLKKKADSEGEEEEEEEEEEDEETHGRQKHTVNIPITFNDSGRRGPPSRGGRGGPRGGRGGPRGGRGGDRIPQSGKGNVAPNVADEMDFPSLS